MATISDNPSDLESKDGSVIAAAAVTVTISSCFVLVRFLTRWTVVRAFGLSDWAILIALLFSIGNSIATTFEVTVGVTGRHLTAVLASPDSPDRMINGDKAAYFKTIFYIVSLVTVKLSILLLYLRIFGSTTIHRLCHAVIIIVGVLGFWTLISSILACVPVAAAWDPMSHPDAWCFPGPPKWWSDFTIHILTELIILVLPVRFIYKLNLPRAQKIGLYVLFAFGSVVCLVSLLRLPSLITLSRSTDPTWDAATVAIWTCIELNIAIICACCMTLRPLVARVFPRLLPTGYRRHTDEPPNHVRQYLVTVGGSRKDRRRPVADPFSLDHIDRMPESPPKTPSSSRDGSTTEITSAWSSRMPAATSLAGSPGG